VFHERFKKAAERVLTDDSMDAARTLEGVRSTTIPATSA
jgi:hypothetical protein